LSPFAEPVNAEHCRQLLDQQSRYFEAQAGVSLEVEGIKTDPRRKLRCAGARNGDKLPIAWAAKLPHSALGGG